METLETRSLLATITVTSAEDNLYEDGLVTLREALLAAETDTSVDGSTAGNGADVIRFAPHLAGRTIRLQSKGDYTLGGSAFGITTEVTIEGEPERGQVLLRDVAEAFRTFFVHETGNLTLKNLTLQGGFSQGGHATGAGGGGAGMGGAIFNDRGTVVAVNTTISHNLVAGRFGGKPDLRSGEGRGYGGIFNYDGAITLLHVSMADNKATSEGSPIYQYSGSLEIINTGIESIVVLYGGTATGSHNLLHYGLAVAEAGASATFNFTNTSTAWRVGNNDLYDMTPLTAGPWPTKVRLVRTSIDAFASVIDKGTPSVFDHPLFLVETDARNRPRSVDGNNDLTALPDIGAVEFQPREDRAASIPSDIIGRDANAGYWYVSQTNADGTAFDIHGDVSGRWSPSSDWQDVVTGDFNGDGKTDIAGRGNGSWWIAISDGGRFINHLAARWSPTATWEDVVTGDFNGDGRADIAGRANGKWWVARSIGSKFVNELWATWSTSTTWLNVMVGDFNRDGIADIVGRAEHTDVWWVGLSNGLSFTNKKWDSWGYDLDWVDVTIGIF